MSEWRIVPDSNVEVCNDGRVRRAGVEFEPYVGNCGYRRLGLNNKDILLHRLIAIAFVPNPELKRSVDHADGNRLNNRVENLRWATDSENRRNRKNNIKVSHLPVGVAKDKKRFAARIKYEGKNYYLGSYDTPEEASKIYEVTAEELFGEFYRMP
jgi:hypothetical protein